MAQVNVPSSAAPAALRPLPESHLRSLSNIEAGFWWYRARIEWAKRLIKTWWLDADDNATNYADLGCGTGGFAAEIARVFEMHDVALVDGDRKALEFVKVPKNFKVLQKDFGGDWKLPFKPNLVTCMDVIEHLEDDLRFLKNVYAQMKPGGCLILSVPAHPLLYSDWDQKLGHYRRYTKRSLQKQVRAAGFKIVRTKFMWSFLMPGAPLRKFKKVPDRDVSFTKVPRPLNALLILLSDLEWHVSERLAPPFGTSLILSAVKL